MIILCLIVILYIVSPSKIIAGPTNTSAAVPFSGVFTCSVISNGHQIITWHKQPGVLPHKHRTTETTSHGIVTSTLIILNVTEEDVGKYHCQVWANKIGIRSGKAVLHYAGSCICTYICTS